jgi:AsmA family protein
VQPDLGDGPLCRTHHDQGAAGQPVRLHLNGRLDQTPVRLQVSTGSFADFAGDSTRVPFAITAQAADTRLILDGEVTLPLGSAGQLSFGIGGERLDSLSELARVELPPWGPWSLSGPIRMSSSGYELQALTLVVGQSRLEGSGKLDLSGPRPRAELRVAAPSIQLDDFPMPQRLTEPIEPPVPEGGMRTTASRTAGRIDRLLSARFLRRFDAAVDVNAGEVLSGADRLADGAFRLQLQEGRLDLDPAVLNLPGGGMRLSMSYDLKQSEVDFQVAARIERFDYGIIARRLNRADNLRGLFSLNLELAGTAPSLDSTLRHANGRLDIAVWPTELRSGVFNLWSANLVLALLPLIDPGQTSQVNCIVGRFDLKDGDLIEDKLLIDTGTVRIAGTGHADLRSEELAFVFRPRAKGPGLFRLQTPLRVSGTLSDQRFGVDPRDVFYSTLRMIASPILVPIERLTLGPLPRDGADVCTDPLRAGSR